MKHSQIVTYYNYFITNLFIIYIQVHIQLKLSDLLLFYVQRIEILYHRIDLLLFILFAFKITFDFATNRIFEIIFKFIYLFEFFDIGEHRTVPYRCILMWEYEHLFQIIRLFTFCMNKHIIHKINRQNIRLN